MVSDESGRKYNSTHLFKFETNSCNERQTSKRKEVCFLMCTGDLLQNSDSMSWLRSLPSEAAAFHFRKATRPRRVGSGFRDRKAMGRCIWAENVDPLVRHLNRQACLFSLSQGPLVFMNLCPSLKQHRGDTAFDCV